MEIRKLKPSEHGRTRSLWEAVFPDDTKAFLDYYYNIKTIGNEIYVAENQNHEICSMLQLNPYMMQMGECEFNSHYIVGVATREDYRKRGLMRELLHASLLNMYVRGEIFTFLMPAAEAIYRPYDFRFVYRQKQGIVKGKRDEKAEYVFRNAIPEDCEAMAEFAREQLAPYQVYAKRDSAYYAVMQKEQESENGSVMLIQKGEMLTGFFAYAKSANGYEIREPLLAKGHEDAILHAVYRLTGDENAAVKCYGIETAVNDAVSKPIIMFRILHPEAVFEAIIAMDTLDVYLNITDPIITENNGCFHLTAAAGKSVRAVKMAERQEADTITIAALASLLFGYLGLDAIIGEEGVSLSAETAMQLEKLRPLSKIFLNEIV
ncbi:MAG: GNAT family N-acetyltransferase [Lachnospiraceae bacterium]